MSISIIIPVYNSEKYLKECVTSIVNQTYKNFEVIFVDDGSTDNSGIICDEICSLDSRFRVFHKKNEGVSVARNIGINMAKFDYITFIDSDDIVSSIYLEVLQKNMVDGGLSSCELTSSINTLSNKREHEEVIVLSPSDAITTMLTPPDSSIVLGPYCKLFDRKVILNHNIFFNENYAIAEDLLFNSAYISKCNGNVIHIRKKLYYWRPSSGISINRFKKKNVAPKLLSTFKAMRDASMYYSDSKIKELFALRACKGAADDLRLMTASNFKSNTLKKELQTHIRKYLKRFLKCNYYYSAKLSVVLAVISPRLEYISWKIINYTRNMRRTGDE